MSERKMFKFFKSYYDVAQELSDKDRLLFYDAIMKKQFYGIETELNGMSKFAYISQKHSIDKQVKGWEDVTKSTLSDPTIDPMQGCVIDPMIDPTIQVEVKEEVKVEGEEEKPTTKVDVPAFLKWFSDLKLKHTGKKGTFKTLTQTNINNLKKLREVYTIKEFEKAFIAMTKSKWVIDNDMVLPKHFLPNDNFERYLNAYKDEQEQPIYKAPWQ